MQDAETLARIDAGGCVFNQTNAGISALFHLIVFLYLNTHTADLKSPLHFLYD